MFSIGSAVTRVGNFALSGEVKDSLKFVTQLGSFLRLAKVDDQYPRVVQAASYTKQWDYVDLLAGRLPRVCKSAWGVYSGQETLSNFSFNLLSFAAGGVKVAAWHIDSLPVLSRLSLPLSALTASVSGGRQLLQVVELKDRCQAFDLAKAQDIYDNHALGGSYDSEVKRLLVQEGLEPDDEVVAYLRGHLRCEVLRSLSSAVHTVAIATLLVAASAFEMGPWIAGSILILMATDHLARGVIDLMAKTPRYAVPLREVVVVS